MNSRAFFESLWTEPMTAEEEQPSLCRFSVPFQQWAETLITPVLQRPTHVGINQAKILLLDKYFEWRNVAPRAHRDKVNTAGHTCLWHVFEAAYNRLKEAELSLTPPMLFVPPPPPALPPPTQPSRPQITGIFLGVEE
jgi:hypothetical protein